MVLPPPGQPQNVTSVVMTPYFLVTSSRQGLLAYYLVRDCSPVNEYRHDSGVTRVFPQPDGSRVVFEDDRAQLYLFNPVNDQVRVCRQDKAGRCWEAGSGRWSCQDEGAAYALLLASLHLLYLSTGLCTGRRPWGTPVSAQCARHLRWASDVWLALPLQA